MAEWMKLVLLGTNGLNGLTEAQHEDAQSQIAEIVTDCAESDQIEIYSADGYSFDEMMSRSIERLMAPHDGRVRRHKYCLTGEVFESFCEREMAMGIEIDATRILQHGNWIGDAGMRRLASRSVSDVVQARDIAMIAAAAAAGATACISIDAKWHPSQEGTSARTIAKRFGMDVVRFVFELSGEKLTYREA